MVKVRIDAAAAAAADSREADRPELTLYQPGETKPAREPARELNPRDFAPVPTEIVCPLTGEIVEASDADGLIDMFERLQLKLKAMTAATWEVRRALGRLTEGDARTRRVIGHRRAAKLEFPGVDYDNAILKRAWDSYPDFRDGYLRIEKISPRLREFKKLANSSGTPEFVEFRDFVLAAEREPHGQPTVTIEK